MIWWLPLFVVLVAGGTLLWLIIHGAVDSRLHIFFVVFIVPAACLICLLGLLVAAIRKRPHQFVSVLLALLGFVAISASLERNEETLRPFVRWFLWSRQYKAEVMGQPDAANGEFKHSVWDRWGFVSTGFTTTYLVFDPTDSLANAAKSTVPVRFSGIPCEVPGVFRLEKQWYAVRFFTSEDWRNCPSSTPRVN